MAEARNGTNATELLMFANDILRNDVSQAIAKIAKAMNPFQNFESEADGMDQGSANNPANAAIAARQSGHKDDRGRHTPLLARSSLLLLPEGEGKPLSSRYQPTVPFA
jgi:hypothetical protein